MISMIAGAVPPSPFRYFNSSPEVTLAIKDRNASFRERLALDCQHRHLVCNFPTLAMRRKFARVRADSVAQRISNPWIRAFGGAWRS